MDNSNLYFFYTVGCGWCTKSLPLIDELNKDGHNILKLDLDEPDNKEIQQELKQQYNFLDRGMSSEHEILFSSLSLFLVEMLGLKVRVS